MNLIMSFPRFDILKAFDCSVLQLISNSNANIQWERLIFWWNIIFFFALVWVNEWRTYFAIYGFAAVMLMQISLFSLSIYTCSICTCLNKCINFTTIMRSHISTRFVFFIFLILKIVTCIHCISVRPPFLRSISL